MKEDTRFQSVVPASELVALAMMIRTVDWDNTYRSLGLSSAYERFFVGLKRTGRICTDLIKEKGVEATCDTVVSHEGITQADVLTIIDFLISNNIFDQEKLPILYEWYLSTIEDHSSYPRIINNRPV